MDWCFNILFQPFWPTGSGCARGFLSSLDACWAVKSWGSGQATPLDVLAERESIYRLLGQTTPENLQRDTTSYTLDPHTRYPNLNARCVLPFQVQGLYDADDPTAVQQCLVSASAQEMPKKRRRKGKGLHWWSFVEMMFQLTQQLNYSFNLLPRAFLVAVQHIRTCWMYLWLWDSHAVLLKILVSMWHSCIGWAVEQCLPFWEIILLSSTGTSRHSDPSTFLELLTHWQSIAPQKMWLWLCSSSTTVRSSHLTQYYNCWSILGLPFWKLPVALWFIWQCSYCLRVKKVVKSHSLFWCSMVMKSNKLGLMRGWTWIDNITRPHCWLCVSQLTVLVFQKVWMDCTVAIVVATWDLNLEFLCCNINEQVTWILMWMLLHVWFWGDFLPIIGENLK